MPLDPAKMAETEPGKKSLGSASPGAQAHQSAGITAKRQLKNPVCFRANDSRLGLVLLCIKIL